MYRVTGLADYRNFLAFTVRRVWFWRYVRNAALFFLEAVVVLNKASSLAFIIKSPWLSIYEGIDTASKQVLGVFACLSGG